MEFYIRLLELLNVDEENCRGVITKIVNKTGLKRGQVSDLIHNRGKMISKRTLSKICDYLIQQGVVEEAELPGALFGHRPDRFWDLLARRARLEFCMGVRQDPKWFDQLVMAADAELQARLLYHVSASSALGWHGHAAGHSGDGQLLHPRFIGSPRVDRANEKQIREQARRIYDEFTTERNDKALILLGSMKSNPVAELSFARCFRNANPFVSQDDVDDANDRDCPFVIIYRDDDPHPTSLCGGLRLSRSEAGEGPGIYYQTSSGSWRRCAWDKKSDAALVFYRFHKSHGQLDMVLGGFSARATRCLANFLGNNEVHRLWPPVYTDDELDVGVFVLHFTFKGTQSGSRFSYEPPQSTEVIPLPTVVVEHRVNKTAPRAKVPAASRQRSARKRASGKRPR